MMNRTEILNNLYIGVQKNSSERLEKKQSSLEGIEMYLYIRPEGKADFIAKLKDGALEHEGIDRAEAWKRAEENTHNDTKIASMSEIIFGKKDPDDQLFVITNSIGVKGAGAITDKESIKAWAYEHGTHRILVLPSSVHEMIIADADKVGASGNLEEFNHMVTEVNNTEVIPEERLTDRAYLMEV